VAAVLTPDVSDELPPNDLPLGGKFEGGIAPLGTFAAQPGPHSIVEGLDGKLYMTCSLAAEIGIFDPISRKFEFVPTGGDTLYPHTLRFDRKGILWFTLALSHHKISGEGHHVLNLPYGIDINPIDGSVFRRRVSSQIQR